MEFLLLSGFFRPRIKILIGFFNVQVNDQANNWIFKLVIFQKKPVLKHHLPVSALCLGDISLSDINLKFIKGCNAIEKPDSVWLFWVQMYSFLWIMCIYQMHWSRTLFIDSKKLGMLKCVTWVTLMREKFFWKKFEIDRTSRRIPFSAPTHFWNFKNDPIWVNFF